LQLDQRVPTPPPVKNQHESKPPFEKTSHSHKTPPAVVYRGLLETPQRNGDEDVLHRYRQRSTYFEKMARVLRQKQKGNFHNQLPHLQPHSNGSKTDRPHDRSSKRSNASDDESSDSDRDSTEEKHPNERSQSRLSRCSSKNASTRAASPLLLSDQAVNKAQQLVAAEKELTQQADYKPVYSNGIHNIERKAVDSSDEEEEESHGMIRKSTPERQATSKAANANAAPQGEWLSLMEHAEDDGVPLTSISDKTRAAILFIRAHADQSRFVQPEIHDLVETLDMECDLSKIKNFQGLTEMILRLRKEKYALVNCLAMDLKQLEQEDEQLRELQLAHKQQIEQLQHKVNLLEAENGSLSVDLEVAKEFQLKFFKSGEKVNELETLKQKFISVEQWWKEEQEKCSKLVLEKQELTKKLSELEAKPHEGYVTSEKFLAMKEYAEKQTESVNAGKFYQVSQASMAKKKMEETESFLQTAQNQIHNALLLLDKSISFAENFANGNIDSSSLNTQTQNLRLQFQSMKDACLNQNNSDSLGETENLKNKDITIQEVVVENQRTGQKEQVDPEPQNAFSEKNIPEQEISGPDVAGDKDSVTQGSDQGKFGATNEAGHLPPEAQADSDSAVSKGEDSDISCNPDEVAHVTDTVEPSAVEPSADLASALAEAEKLQCELQQQVQQLKEQLKQKEVKIMILEDEAKTKLISLQKDSAKNSLETNGEHEAQLTQRLAEQVALTEEQMAIVKELREQIAQVDLGYAAVPETSIGNLEENISPEDMVEETEERISELQDEFAAVAATMKQLRSNFRKIRNLPASAIDLLKSTMQFASMAKQQEPLQEPPSSAPSITGTIDPTIPRSTTEWQQLLEQQKQENLELEAKLSEADGRDGKLQEEIDRLNKELQELRADRAKESDQALERQVKMMEEHEQLVNSQNSTITTLRDKYSKLILMYDARTRQLMHRVGFNKATSICLKTVLRYHLDKNISLHVAAVRTCKNLGGTLSEKQQQLAAVEATLAEIESRLTKQFEKNLAKVQKEYDVLKHTFEETVFNASQQRNELSRDRDKWAKDAAELSAALATSKADVTYLTAQAEKTSADAKALLEKERKEFSTVSSILEATQAELKHTVDERTKVKKAYVTLQKTMTNSTSKMNELNSQLQESRKQYRESINAKMVQDASLTETRMELHELTTKNDDLQKALKAVSAAYAEAQEKVNRLNFQLDLLKKEVTYAKDENRVLLVEIKTLTAEAETKRREHAEGELENLKSELRNQAILATKLRSHEKRTKTEQIQQALEKSTHRRAQSTDGKFFSEPTSPQY